MKACKTPVEIDPFCHAYALSILEKDSNRYSLHFASDGTDVLENIENPQFLPDLILLDLNMPVTNGFEMRKHLKNSPIY